MLVTTKEMFEKSMREGFAIGAFNVNNILAAIAVGIEIGLDINKILPSVESFQGVNGRLQKQEIK